MRGSQSSLPPPWWRGGERAGLLLAGDCLVLRRVAEGGMEQVTGGAAQSQGLARLVEQTGTAVRVISGLAAQHRDPVWVPVTVVFHELVVLSR